MNYFNDTLVQHGADPDSLHRFDTPGPDLLPYATLLNARNAGDEHLASLVGVYEWQDSPLIFLVDGDAVREEDLRAIRRRLAMRGDAPYLGVVRPGRLEVYRVSLDAKPPSRSLVPLNVPPAQTLAHLGNHRPGASADRSRWISEVVLKLLHQSISELTQSPEVTGEDAISLVGRALFTRFLADRGLLPASLVPRGAADAMHLFDNPKHAEATSLWLDRTFNGEFLPLRPGLFGRLTESAFGTLGNVLRRAPGGQYSLEWTEDWAHLDFAHIPVGVLSQSYELFLRSHQPDKQRKEGGYYTPASIAQLMVRAAFHALRRDGAAYEARVLDPAAGAGVFLLHAFRQLVAERWRHDGVRPDTRVLREILYRQITGFDINESALRFAALGLYLLSIELDPDPEPVEKLRFEDLRKSSVLCKVGDKGELGSLGDRLGDDHASRYDLVIGNPPWSSATKLAEWPQAEARVQRIAASRLPYGRLRRLLPNDVLDLPFVWRAMEWARPDGQIAFALHARLLFQQYDGMAEARAALFGALDVTGVINGAELRQTNVWPEISAPFCLLFARNAPAAPGAGFRFVTPHLEDRLNRAGSLRIDSVNAIMVTSDQVTRRPELLKILFRGGVMDLELYDKVSARGLRSLRQYWQEYFGGSGMKLECAGNGYQKLRPSSRPRKKGGDGKPGVSATYLSDLRELTPDAMRSFLVDRSLLSNFKLDRIHDPRPRSLFQGPLLLVHKSPPARAGRIRVSVSDEDLIFNETYYGYSAHKHPDGRRLVRYLALLIGSRPAFWHCLVTSGEFGFERDVVEKATIDGIPVPSFESLNAARLREIDALFDSVAAHDSDDTWAKVDAWVAGLYGLRDSDLHVLEDTLRFGLPFAANRLEAQASPNQQQIEVFCEALSTELTPWAARGKTTLVVHPHLLPPGSPWQLVHVQVGRPAVPDAREGGIEDELLRVADQLAATEVLRRDIGGSSIWIAKLAQARYWSRSQARAVARRIVWEHVDMLLGGSAA